jgi:hypothetical protein
MFGFSLSGCCNFAVRILPNTPHEIMLIKLHRNPQISRQNAEKRVMTGKNKKKSVVSRQPTIFNLKSNTMKNTVQI